MGARSTGSHPTTAKADGHLLEYFRQNFSAGGGANSGPAVGTGLEATGGNTVNPYTAPDGFLYKAHIFTGSGTFQVTKLGNIGNNVEYLVVAGGGAGGGVGPSGSYHGAGAGGGAGGLRTNLAGHPLAGAAFPVSTTGGNGSGEYTVTIGGGATGDGGSGGTGVNSYFGPPSAPQGITANGGGGGAGGALPGEPGGSNGGSGGGGSRENNTAGSGNTPPTSPSQGNSGGTTGPTGGDGGGGGGAGNAGRSAVDSTNPGDGGIGSQVILAGPPTYNVGALNPGNSQYHYFAGGGGGGEGGNPASEARGLGGAWNGSSLAGTSLSGGGEGGVVDNDPGSAGTANTGGGGGGAGAHRSSSSTNANGGNGGSGIVIIRYRA